MKVLAPLDIKTTNMKSAHRKSIKNLLVFLIIIAILESESFYVSGNSKRNNDYNNPIYHPSLSGYDFNHKTLKDPHTSENDNADEVGNVQRKYSIVSKRGNKIVHTLPSLNSKSFDEFYNKETNNKKDAIVNGIKNIVNIKATKNKIHSIIYRTFLPISYPSKTPKGYLGYVLYSSLQDLSTQLRGVLATQRVLEGLGVGKVGASSLSATLNFIVRDGVGMITSLLFTYLVSDKLKSDVKRWRIFADIIVDFGITLEVLAILVPRQYFLMMICIGNMCKAMCGVAAGSCGGVLNLYWSKGTDISDVNAKFGAQNTVTGGIGLLFAAAFTRWSMKMASSSSSKSLLVSESTMIWTFFTSLTILHIFANAQLMKFVAFDYLNHTRMNIIMQSFINRLDKNCNHDGILKLEATNVDNNIDAAIFPSPEKMAKIEPLIFWNVFRTQVKPPLHIRFGVSFDTLVTSSKSSFDQIQKLMFGYNEEEYIIALSQKRKEILVCLKSNASHISKAKAYFHAWILGYYLRSNKTATSAVDNDHLQEKYVQENIPLLWNTFRSSVSNAGWDLSQTELANKGYEVDISVAT